MSKMLALVLGSLAMLALLFFLMARKDNPGANSGHASSGQSPLMIYCAASNRAVMEDIRKAYEEETGRRVQVQYGSSQTLLSSLEVSRNGDLYLPADDSFLTVADDKNLIAEVLSIATMHAVVVVPKGNPKQITRFEDLLRDDVRTVQASPDSAAVGKLTRELLSQSGLWEKLHAATEGYRSTVTDVANDLLVGAADAGIVYDAVLSTYPDLTAVELPELAAATSQVSVGVLDFSTQPTAALHFARYITAADRGLERYQHYGFRTSPGDHWAETPELTLFAGSMLRPAIEETIDKFERREGVHVSRNYNGCGILVAQMKSGQHPDAYFACDTEFMRQMGDLFPNSVDVSQNELVILVQKGNPHNIKSLKDLTRPGLRVGIGHENQCAMGWITQNTFREGGLQTEVMANVTVQTPTGDMLVNQMRSGSLDAAVAYLSNAAGSGDFLDAVQILGISCSTAIQPWGIATDSRYPQTMARLFTALASAESQTVFAAEGFRWNLKADSKTDAIRFKP